MNIQATLPLLNRQRPLLSASVILFAALAVCGCSGPSVVAKVGNETITEKQVLDYVESTQGGAQIVTPLIMQSVAEQSAKEQGVTPTDDDVSGELADFQAENGSNPQIAELIAKDKPMLLRNMRMEAALDNILKKGADMSDANLRKWFEAHRATFDQPQRISVETFVFTDQGKARTGKALLAKGSGASDVATLGDTTFPQNGQTSPVQTEAQMVQGLTQMGPELTQTIHEFFAPGVKTGFTAGPIPVNIPGLGKRFAVIRLATSEPAKSATFEENKKLVTRFMPAEQYAREHLKANIPPSMPMNYYRQVLLNGVRQQLLMTLLRDYQAKNKISINPPRLRDVIMKELQPAPAPGAPGAGAAPGEAAPPPGAPVADTAPPPTGASDAPVGPPDKSASSH